jgi:hypothetical protein
VLQPEWPEYTIILTRAELELRVALATPQRRRESTLRLVSQLKSSKVKGSKQDKAREWQGQGKDIAKGSCKGKDTSTSKVR